MAGTILARGRRPAASLRTLFLGLGGLVVMALVRTAVVLDYGGADGVALISNFAEAFLSAGAAFVVLSVVLYVRSQGVGARQWGFLGIAVTLYAMGNIAWTHQEFTQGVVPFPGLPDWFYIPAYLMLAASLLSAAYALRDLVDIRPAFGFALTVGVVLLGIAFVGLLQPFVLSDASVSLAEKSLSVFYPVADILLLVVPGIAAMIVLVRFDSAELVWPWGIVVGGTVVLAITDTAFAVLAAAGTYQAGALVDYGWMACHVAFAVGASLEADVIAHQALVKREAVARTLEPSRQAT